MIFYRNGNYKNEGLDLMSIDGLGKTMRLTEKNVGRYELIYCDRWIYSKHRKDVDKFREISCTGCPSIDVCKVADYISEVFDEL